MEKFYVSGIAGWKIVNTRKDHMRRIHFDGLSQNLMENQLLLVS